MIPAHRDHAYELHRASAVRLIDVTDQTVVASNQAAAVAAGLSRDRTALLVSAMKLPKPIRECLSIAGTPRPGLASGRSLQFRHRRLNRADKRPKEKGHA
jgi:hypothetical protein